MSRDRGCRFSGCPATHRLHGHHVRHWADGRETALDNLVLLCPVRHRLVHEGGFDVRRLDDGALRFTAPNGAAVRAPALREPSSSDTILSHNDALGLAINRETAMARWHGERIDYDHAVMVTVHAWNRGGLRFGHLGTPESREEHLPANSHEVLPSARESSFAP